MHHRIGGNGIKKASEKKASHHLFYSLKNIIKNNERIENAVFTTSYFKNVRISIADFLYKRSKICDKRSATCLRQDFACLTGRQGRQVRAFTPIVQIHKSEVKPRELPRFNLGLRGASAGFTLIEPRQRRTNSRMNPAGAGFTLIELLVVISIISLLATIVLSSLNDARAKARDAQRITEMKELQKALWLYYDDNNQTYPTESNSASSCDGSFSSALNDLVADGYIPEIPVDPENSSSCYYYSTSNFYSCEKAPSSGFVLFFSTETTNLNLDNLYLYSGSDWNGPFPFYCID